MSGPTDVLSRWLDALAPGAGARWSPVLSALPLRPTFEAAPDAVDDRLYAVEASLREDGRGRTSDGLRLAITLDPARLPTSWIAALARRVSPGLAEHGTVDWVASLLRGGRLDGLLFGLDGTRRAKLYLYASDAARIAEDLGLPPARVGLTVAFLAVDLLPTGERSVKRYLSAPDRATAATALLALGAGGLAERVITLPAATDTVPHGLVITERIDASGAQRDVTLHARAEGLGDAARLLAGPGLLARLAEVRSAVPEVDTRVTHLAWLSDGSRSLYGVPRPAAGTSR